MAYGRGENGQDDLEAQLIRQMEPPVFNPSGQNGGWQTYGGYERAQNAMQQDGVSPEAQQGALAGLSALGTEMKRDSSMQQDRANPDMAKKQSPFAQPATAGVTSPSMMTGGAFARYGTGDIEGASGLRTGNYGGEGFSYAQRGAAGERGADTIKNTFGKIASRYDPTQPGAARAVMADPDFQRFFPEAKLVEHPNGDLIDFGDGKPVDVLRAARAGGAGEAWQWGAQDDGGGGMAGGGGLGQGVTVNSLMSGDPMAAINEQIAGLTSGQDSQIQELIQQILSGQQGI